MHSVHVHVLNINYYGNVQIVHTCVIIQIKLTFSDASPCIHVYSVITMVIEPMVVHMHTFKTMNLYSTKHDSTCE